MTKSFAMVFPGQGSQAVGMLASLAAETRVVAETFDEASGALGFDLWKLVSEGPEADLNQTHNTQPAMLAAGVAVWRAWQAAAGPQPGLLAGHSLGEYTALVCAGALDFPDAISLVAERGRLMQDAVPQGQGAMAAVLGLDDEAVRALCASAAGDGVVEAVNFNAPGQVVIAGDRSAVDRASEAAKSAGAKRVIALPVSAPSHCSLMKPAADKLAERLQQIDIRPPRIPVIHNVNVATEASPEAIKALLAAQLYSPVRWVETVLAMKNADAPLIVEAGPGKVLAGLVRRIDKSMSGFAVFDTQGITAAKEALHD